MDPVAFPSSIRGRRGPILNRTVRRLLSSELCAIHKILAFIQQQIIKCHPEILLKSIYGCKQTIQQREVEKNSLHQCQEVFQTFKSSEADTVAMRLHIHHRMPLGCNQSITVINVTWYIQTHTCLLPIGVLSKSLETIRMRKEGGGFGMDDGEVVSPNGNKLLLLSIVV